MNRKYFHAYLKVRELYYAGGVLFVSGKRIIFWLPLYFCRILLLVSISRSLKQRQMDLLVMIAYLSNKSLSSIN